MLEMNFAIQANFDITSHWCHQNKISTLVLSWQIWLNYTFFIFSKRVFEEAIRQLEAIVTLAIH